MGPRREGSCWPFAGRHHRATSWPCISRPGLGVDGDQRCDGWGAAQLVQAAAAARPDAADRDAQPGADLGICQGRVLDEQGDQLLAAGGR